ncbi:DUF5652 family protein [Lapillicoccus jejuensis]|uniref:DUF5652 domain-containing protein n=1 Tax=Lapillicoccus jejuensis TaxID=402171 RepID=A0A542DZU7_9MICO|nr:DUF5652 family protein [Lapillicoccus jejuensis]TQJ08637.1 hypothetical protein FB458_1728 [Lapillicoccus jejuensis]
MTRRPWSEIDPRVRGAIWLLGTLEGVLKLVALVDLWRRPAAQVRGSKRRWAVAIAVPNTVGVVPLIYLLRGRRTTGR